MRSKREDNRVLTLSNEDTAFFCNQTAIVLKSGLPLAEGVESLAEEYRGTRGEGAMRALSEALNQTGSLSEALRDAPVLPDYAIRMIAIGESAGTLDDVLDGLSNYYLRERQILDRIRSAVTYPAILTLMMGGVIAVLLFRVLPVFARVLDSMGAGGSRTGAAVTRLGAILGGCALAVTVLILFAIAALALGLRGKRRSALIDRVLMRVPLLRRTIRALSAERFSSVMAMLVRTGYPMDDALSQVADIPVDGDSRRRILKMRDLVAAGESFACAVAQCELFDSLHGRMLSMAASAGMMDSTLDKLASIYGERLDRGVQACEALIEPALVSLLAIVAGAVLLAVMLPLANMLAGIF